MLKTNKLVKPSFGYINNYYRIEQNRNKIKLTFYKYNWSEYN